MVLGTGARSSGVGGLFASPTLIRPTQILLWAEYCCATRFGVQTVAVVCGHEAYGAHGVQCESCKRFQSQLTNDEGNSVALGSDGNHQYQDYYCGERRQIPGTDGQCGPNNGRACASCVRLREAIEAVGASEPRIDTGFSFAPRPTLNDRAMRQRPLLPPYCLPGCRSRRRSRSRAPTATRPRRRRRRLCRARTCSGRRRTRTLSSSRASCGACARPVVPGRHAPRAGALLGAPRGAAAVPWTFGVEQPVGSLAAHKHALVPMQSSANTCDIGGPGCRGSALRSSARRGATSMSARCAPPRRRRASCTWRSGSCSTRGRTIVTRPSIRQCSTPLKACTPTGRPPAISCASTISSTRSATSSSNFSSTCRRVSFTLVSSPSRRRARRAAPPTAAARASSRTRCSSCRRCRRAMLGCSVPT